MMRGRASFQIAKSRSYLNTLGPKTSIPHRLGALGFLARRAFEDGMFEG